MAARAVGIGCAAWAALATLALSACSQTTRVGEATSAEELAKGHKAVAVMRLGAASSTCRNVGVWLGTKEGDGYRPLKPVAIIDYHTAADVPVAEVELHPGEYHVISYACEGAGANSKQVSEPFSGGLVRASYASFTVASGEIVNVGSFEFHASRVGTNAFGRPIRTSVTISDWPLADIEKYRSKRPQIFAQMTTRLMKPSGRDTSPGDDECASFSQLQKEGKVQNLPAACSANAQPPPEASQKSARQQQRSLSAQ